MDKFEKVLLERMKKEREAALLALYGGLEQGVERAGGQLTGLNIKWDGAGCLFVVKAEFPAGHQVAFVWADDMAAGLGKIMKESGADKLRWRADRFDRREG